MKRNVRSAYLLLLEVKVRLSEKGCTEVVAHEDYANHEIVYRARFKVEGLDFWGPEFRLDAFEIPSVDELVEKLVEKLAAAPKQP